MTILDEIEARTQAATPGPWDVEKSLPWVGYHIDRANYKIQCWRPFDEYYDPGARTDAEFIAAARTDVPLLCRALRLAAQEVYEAAFDIKIEYDGNKLILFTINEWLKEADNDQSDV